MLHPPTCTESGDSQILSFSYKDGNDIRVQHLGYYFIKSSVLQHNCLIFIITIQFSGCSGERKYVQVIFLLVREHPKRASFFQFPEKNSSPKSYCMPSETSRSVPSVLRLDGVVLFQSQRADLTFLLLTAFCRALQNSFGFDYPVIYSPSPMLFSQGLGIFPLTLLPQSNFPYHLPEVQDPSFLCPSESPE